MLDKTLMKLNLSHCVSAGVPVQAGAGGAAGRGDAVPQLPRQEQLI